MASFRLLAWAAAVGWLASPVAEGAEWLCWSSDQGRKIECAHPDGSQHQQWATSSGKPMGLAVDQAGRTLFWAERDTERIMSASLTQPDTVTTLVQLPVGTGLRGMAIAPSIRKIYWVGENAQVVQRANYDGTNVETLPIPVASFFDVQIDDRAGMLYWTNGTEIWRSNLDATVRNMIVGDTDQPYYLALDLQAGKVYWTDFSRFEIGRANLDGTGRESPGPVAGLPDRPVGIAVDPTTSTMYWTLEGGELQRAGFDGTGVSSVLSGLTSPWDLTIVNALGPAPPIPAASTWGLVALALSLLSAGTILTLRRDGSLARR